GREIRGRRPKTSAELAELVLDEVEVAVVPGEAFGAPGYFRLSYALGDADLVEGVSRLQALLGEARAWAAATPPAPDGQPPGAPYQRCRRHTCTCTSPGRCGMPPCWTSRADTPSGCRRHCVRCGRCTCRPPTSGAGSGSSAC